MIRLTPVLLAAAMGLGMATGAKAGPVDTFDIDVLTASRYGLDKVEHYRPCRERAGQLGAGACDYRAESLPGGRF